MYDFVDVLNSAQGRNWVKRHEDHKQVLAHIINDLQNCLNRFICIANNYQFRRAALQYQKASFRILSVCNTRIPLSEAASLNTTMTFLPYLPLENISSDRRTRSTIMMQELEVDITRMGVPLFSQRFSIIQVQINIESREFKNIIMETDCAGDDNNVLKSGDNLIALNGDAFITGGVFGVASVEAIMKDIIYFLAMSP